MRQGEREREKAEREKQREKQAPCREPDVGFNPGSLGSCPGPKAGAKPLSHSGIPRGAFLWEMHSGIVYAPPQGLETGPPLRGLSLACFF